MKTMDPKNAALQNVLDSDIFKDRETYKKLIKYIVRVSLKGTTPKEITIAQDVFDKGKDFNAAEDTTVRVHIHNLRKMLEQYYDSTGKSDPIKICIPKGSYLAKFVDNGILRSRIRNQVLEHKSAIIIALLLILLGIGIIDRLFLTTSFQVPDGIETDDPVWSHFFDNEYKTSLVIGDFLIFHETDSLNDRTRRIQDYTINTAEEFELYQNSNPGRNVESWSLGELPHNSIFNLTDLQPVFFTFDEKYDINFTTKIDINFIKHRNLIYIGEFKNLRPLSDLVAKIPVKFQTLPWWHGTISYPDNGTVATLHTSHDWKVNRYVVDLAMVAKLPGLNNENYLLFMGFGYNAQIKIVHLFSHQSELKLLEKQITSQNGTVPDYFVAVFEVTGFDRASTEAELKYFSEIKKDYYREYGQ